MSRLRSWLSNVVRKLTGDDGLGPEPKVEGSVPGSVSHRWALWYSQKHNVEYRIAMQIGRSRLHQLKLHKGSTP